jgi:hypothetical protein
MFPCVLDGCFEPKLCSASNYIIHSIIVYETYNIALLQTKKSLMPTPQCFLNYSRKKLINCWKIYKVYVSQEPVNLFTLGKSSISQLIFALYILYDI